MANATLTSFDVSAKPLNDCSIMNSNGENVSTIHGPITYTYTLTYVSIEPLNMSEFPSEINAEEINNQINENKCMTLLELAYQLKAERAEKLKQQKLKEKQEILKITNAIQSLEVSDTLS